MTGWRQAFVTHPLRPGSSGRAEVQRRTITGGRSRFPDEQTLDRCSPGCFLSFSGVWRRCTQDGIQPSQPVHKRAQCCGFSLELANRLLWVPSAGFARSLAAGGRCTARTAEGDQHSRLLVTYRRTSSLHRLGLCALRPGLSEHGQPFPECTQPAVRNHFACHNAWVGLPVFEPRDRAKMEGGLVGLGCNIHNPVHNCPDSRCRSMARVATTSRGRSPLWQFVRCQLAPIGGWQRPQ